MNKQEKNEVIEVLKDKFSQYNNFYITNTESLSVAQVNKLRGICFNKKVEMKVAKNTLIKKALESLNKDRFANVYDSLHGVTALMFSENAKEPALIITSFRRENNNEKPVLKAAFIDGDVYSWRQSAESADHAEKQTGSSWRTHRPVAVTSEECYQRPECRQ